MPRRVATLVPGLVVLWSGLALAQPAVVATGEGQIGKTPPQPSLDRVHPPGFAPVTLPGPSIFEGNVALGVLFEEGGLLALPPEFQVVEDRFYSAIFPAIEIDAVPATFAEVDKVAPVVEPWLSSDDTISTLFAQDGSGVDTMTLTIATYTLLNSGVQTWEVEIPDVPTFSVPDERFAEADLAVDFLDRVTGVFTEVPAGGLPKVKAVLIDEFGDLTDLFAVNDGSDAEVAAVAPDGTRLIIPSVPVDSGAPDFGTIQGNFLDLDGPLPEVLPEFPISTTPAAVTTARPAVAADPVTGDFTVVWDFITGIQGDPTDIRGRRFDADGVPYGDDFLVNVKLPLGDDNSQGQADVAYGPGGLSVVVWATDGATGDPDTNIAGRAYLPDGTPIGLLFSSQFLVNTGNPPGGPLSDRQDHPGVRFLPEPDSSGRPQFAVVWRDVGDGSGADPNGTGSSYRCFSIDGLDEQAPIFEDGFESGDYSTWSSANPP